MKMKGLDHVNIRTRDVKRLADWYGDILGLHAGARPPFPFGGAWLYCGDKPIVHLVEVAEQPTGRRAYARALRDRRGGAG